MAKKFINQCPDCKSKDISEIYKASEYNDISYKKEFYDRKCNKCNYEWSKDTKYCTRCKDVVMYCDCYKGYIEDLYY